MRKPNADKRHLTYSTRDIYSEYRKHYKDSTTKVDRMTWNLVIDSIIEKIKKEVLVNRQIYKPRGGVGVFRMAKRERIENFTTYQELGGDFYFLFYWENRYPYVKSFKNKDIYKIKSLRAFKHEIRDHILKLERDPYQRDYNTALV